MNHLAHRLDYLGKLHQIVLHEVYLGVIRLLHLVQHAFVPGADLINLQVYFLYLLLVYFFSGVCCQLLMGQFITQSACHLRVETGRANPVLALL